MAPRYQQSGDGPLRQGEVLCGLIEVRPLIVPSSIATSGTAVDFRTIPHPRTAVMNSECDLEWDYRARAKTDDLESILEHPHSIPHIFLIDLHEEATIRGFEGVNAGIFKRIKTNQHERFHCLSAGAVDRSEPPTELPELFVDFKKTVALPTELVYGAISDQATTRAGVIPPVFLHQLSQRFYSFHSRVGTPED